MTRTKSTDPIVASIEIDAPAHEVWAVVSDLRRMGEWSPQCRRMRVFGEVRLGARTFNINRQGKLVWPTNSRVVRYEPQKAIGFRILENRTVWTYALEPATGGATRVTATREAPHGITGASNFLVKNVLGGIPEFEQSLEEGLRTTLTRIKETVESEHAAA